MGVDWEAHMDEECAARQAIQVINSVIDPDFQYLSPMEIEEYRAILLRPLYEKLHELLVREDARAWAELGAR